MISGASFLAVLLSCFVISRVLAYRSAITKLERAGIPCLTCIFGIFTPVGILGPTTWWNPGVNFPVRWRNQVYERNGQDIIGFVPLFFGQPAVYTRSMEAFKQVALPLQPRYNKREETNKVLRLFGDNIVATDGAQWKRHRRIAQPAFNQKTYDFVWSETARLYNEMVDVEGWKRREGPIDFTSIGFIGFKLALFVIASAGFGIHFSWAQPPTSADMTLQDAFRIFATTTVQRMMIPKWAYMLPINYLKKINKAYEVMEDFMDRTIAQGKKEARLMASAGETDGLLAQGDTIFARLVEASEKEASSGMGLDDSELRGNVWALLFAGHETTAHTISATFAYLALYPEVQQEVLQVIREVTADDHEPTIDDFSRLDKVTACFLEAIRFCPSGSILTRETSEDLVLDLPENSRDPDSRMRSYPLKKETPFVVDMVGINYNPAYFPDPEEYRPSRWYTEPDAQFGKRAKSEHSFTSFSAGPRVCIGKKFAILEATCFLTHFLRDYEVRLGDHKPGETREQWKAKHLQYTLTFTLRPGDIPITIVRRE